ncbi:MAG TPA: DUF3460 family protein [Burkholderiales bacterium]|nr:DUF3460 family protein [Burkholderiales bacterium]
MAQYESDLTKFMRQYLEQHPEELESQRIGRDAWWDKDPALRTAPPPARHPAKSGGAEYTFRPLTEADKAEK